MIPVRPCYTHGVPKRKPEVEVERVRRILLTVLADRRLSVRALERQAGVAEGSLRKVLHGGQHLSLRYLFLILETLEISWGGFFRTVFRGRPAAGVGTAPGGAPLEDSDDFVRSLVRLLESRQPGTPAEVGNDGHGQSGR